MSNRIILFTLLLITSICMESAYGQLNLTLDSYQGQSNISAGKSVTLKGGFKIEGGKQSRIFIDGSIPPSPDEFTLQGSGVQGTSGSNIGRSSVVGSVSGKAEISSSGSATYTIPITVLSGISGMQPSLTLSYNSAAADGNAGWGWSMNGLSMISRAGKSTYYSGIARPVNYTNGNDAFVLDGERLSAISGTNGSNGTVYATEKENFAKIESFGGSETSGPEWFRVTAKDGKVMEYGRATNTKFLTDDGQSTMFWFLSKAIDINGNSMVYNYNVSAANRSFALASIGYLSNENTGQPATTLLQLDYQVRSNWNGTTVYEGGASVNRMYNLEKVSVMDPSGNTVKTYQCSYVQNGKKYLLSSIKETGSDGKELTPTTFSYGDETPTPETQELFNANLVFATQVYIGDYDGDGKRDLLSETSKYDNNGQIKYTTDIKIYSNYGTNGASVLYSEQIPITSEIISLHNTDIKNGFYSIIPGDYDGDGRDDIMKIKSKLVSFSGYNPISTITGISVSSINPSGALTGTTNNYPVNATDMYGRSYIYMPPDKSFFYPGDFNGDGLADYILLLGQFNTPGQPSSGIFYKAFFSSPGKNIFNQEIQGLNIEGNSSYNYTATSLVTADRIIPADFNGDGKTDLLVTKDNMTYLLSIERLLLSGGYAGTVLSSSSTITKDNTVFVGDFNGDKKLDLLVRGVNGKNNRNEPWQVFMGTGATSGFPFTAGSYFAFPYAVTIKGDTYFNTSTGSGDIRSIQIADFDGDGKTDVASFIRLASGTVCNVAYMDGKNFEYKTYNTPKITVDYAMADDMNGDGRADMVSATAVLAIYYTKPFSNENLLTKVTQGDGYTTKFGYMELTQRTVSIPNSPASYYYYGRDLAKSVFPYNMTALGLKPVYLMQRSNGLRGMNNTFYRYEDAVLHREGKGFLGFLKMTAYDQATGMAMVMENGLNTTYAELYPTRQYTLGNYYLPHNTGDMLSEQRITTSYKARPSGMMLRRYQTQVDNTLSLDYLSGAATQSTNLYDDYGNVLTSTTLKGALNGSSVAQVESQTTTISYGIHNTPVPALPDNSTVNSSRTGQPEVSKSTSMLYDTKGNLVRKVDFDGKPNALTTDMEYDAYGNLLKTTFSAGGLNSRMSKSTYDALHRFPVRKESVGSGVTRTTESAYDVWGNALSTTSSDGLTTLFTYDGFGRILKTTLPDGQVMVNQLSWATGGNASYIGYTYAPSGGVPDTKKAYDLLGREIASEQSGFNGQKLVASATYNEKGQVVQQYPSHYMSETVVATTSEYDSYGRVTRVTDAKGNTTMSYQNMGGGQMQATTTTPDGQSRSVVVDGSGKKVRSDDNGGYVAFVYDSWGNQLSTSINGAVAVSNTYDDYGRQTKMQDRNSGTFQYEYDAFGQLTKQTDPNGNVATSTYDDFGRKLTVTRKEGTSSYTYYSDGAKNNDNIAKVIGFSGDVTEYAFDNLGRKTMQKKTVNGTSYTDRYAYDSYGNVSAVSYDADGVTIRNSYDGNGILKGRTMEARGRSVVIFTATAMNSKGVYTTYGYGNGRSSKVDYDINNGVYTRFYTDGIQDLRMVWDNRSGNLTSRSDALRNLTETFTYDNLDRLTSATVNNVQQLAMSYDGNGGSSLGNLVTKTDAGSYAYRNDKVNAVAYITNPVGATTPPSVIPTTTQEIAYNSFLKTSTVAQDGYKMELTYGADEQRIRGIYSKDGAVTEERYYLDGYERQIVNGHDRYIHYINGGNGLAAMVVSENGSSRVYFVYSDHLGSILTLTDESGMLEARQNFDAWGRDRNPDDWSYNNLPARPEWLYRGYTGHEHLRQFGLVNMNGRMYDPVQGRMLSPDNYIQQPDNTQSYNRYSYCINNPLKYTDPTGQIFGIDDAFISAMVIGAIISSATYTVSAILEHNWSVGGFVKSAAVGAISGAASFGIGSYFQSGIGSTFSATGRVVGSTFAHALAQGLITGVAGGDALSSMMSAGIGDLAGVGLGSFGNDYVTMGGSVLVGGATSSLSGGKFWDGVRDAAIAVGLNQLAHKAFYDHQLKKMYEAYKNGVDKYPGVEEYFQHFGGELAKEAQNNPSDFANTCATRMSEALNAAGFKIPAGSNTFTDQNGNNYIVNAKDMAAYLSKKWGNPKILKSNETLKNAVFFQTGFDPPVTGHIDIMYRGNAAHNFYSGLGYESIKTAIWP